MPKIQTSGLPAGFKVQPHVQSLADEVERRFGLDHFLTYAGHGSENPRRPDLALDIFATKEVGDRLAAWLVENIEPLGVDYVIWWQRIYNPEVAKHWRDMADRGSKTANHKDHVHVSFNPTAPAGQEFDDMYDTTARNEVVGRLDKALTILDEMFKKVAYLEAEVAKLTKDD